MPIIGDPACSNDGLMMWTGTEFVLIEADSDYCFCHSNDAIKSVKLIGDSLQVTIFKEETESDMNVELSYFGLDYVSHVLPKVTIPASETGDIAVNMELPALTPNTRLCGCSLDITYTHVWEHDYPTLRVKSPLTLYYVPDSMHFWIDLTSHYEGEYRCSSDMPSFSLASMTGRIICQNGIFVMADPCPAGTICLSGECAPTICQEYSYSCFGGKRYRCVDGNRWQLASCPVGTHCENGTCVAGDCIEGERVCDSDGYNLYECQNGTLVLIGRNAPECGYVPPEPKPGISKLPLLIGGVVIGGAVVWYKSRNK